MIVSYKRWSVALTVAYADVQAMVRVIYDYRRFVQAPVLVASYCMASCVLRCVSLAQNRQWRLHGLGPLQEFPFEDCRMQKTITPFRKLIIVWCRTSF